MTGRKAKTVRKLGSPVRREMLHWEAKGDEHDEGPGHEGKPRPAWATDPKVGNAVSRRESGYGRRHRMIMLWIQVIKCLPAAKIPALPNTWWAGALAVAWWMAGVLPSAAQVGWPDLLELGPPSPALVLPYGPEALQSGELRFPDGEGPFPVVMLIHGGCWLEHDAAYMGHLAEALAGRGFATWNIGYRRVGDEGGGWPGTFDDILMAIDALPWLASMYPVDSTGVVVAGHSSGGHLALWAAAAHPKVVGAVGLAAISDLAAYVWGEGGCELAAQELMGGLPDEVPERYARYDPALLGSPPVPVVLVSGGLDDIVPPEHNASYVEMTGARHMVLPEAGHFDLVAPISPVWNRILTVFDAFRPASGR